MLNIRQSTAQIALKAVIGISLLMGASQAGVVYSNFSATPPGYVSDYFYGVWASHLPWAPVGISNWAMGFTATADATVTGFELPLIFRGQTTTLEVSLLSSDLAGKPASVLDSAFISGTSEILQLYSGAFANAPQLIAGKDYWFVVGIAGLLTDQIQWAAVAPFSSGNGGPVANGGINNGNPQPWTVFTESQAAFRLLGEADPSPVPEPSAFLSIGSTVAVAFFYRAKRGVR